MPRSEAQKRADKKYSQSDKYKYTSVAANVKKEDAEQFHCAADERGLTVSRFLFLAAKYCIENNIDLNEN